MRPIYDPQGSVVAWLDDDRIIDLSGQHTALISSTSVITYSGKQMGMFEDGFFRDSGGGAVAFIENASGGPILPIAQIPPVPPVPTIPPIPPIPLIPYVPPVPLLSWSYLSWNDFLSQ